MVHTLTPRILPVLAFAISLVLCAGCATSTAPPPGVPTTGPATSGPPATHTVVPAATTAVYTSAAYGYTLSHPASWEVRSSDGGATVTFTSPAEGPSDTIRENLKVVVKDLSATPMDLDSFVASQMAIRKQGLANFNLIFDNPWKIGPTNGRKIAYTGTLGSDRMEWVEIYTIRGLKAYTLTFTAEQSHYPNFVENLDRSLKSFTFT
jgi:eukaryotic-like serine/threonine-protein kinase